VVRAKVILIAVVTVLAIGSAGVGFLISEKQAAQERRKKFFGMANELPTSGGQKMKPAW
jgi:type IV secretion system protein TrbK